MRTIMFLALFCLLTACGGTRRYGDIDGQPVAFAISLDRDFVSDMHKRAKASVGIGMGFNSHGHSSTGLGIGLHFQSTNVHLLAYDSEAKALLFRQQLKWGENSFTVPLLAQRHLTLVIEATGGRRGQETIGEVRADQEQPISIQLDANGSSLLKLDVTKEKAAE